MPPKSLPSSSNSSGSTSKSSRSVSATTPGQRNELNAHHSSLQTTNKTKGRRVSISPLTESSESTLKSSSTFRTTPKSAGPKNKLTTPRNVSLRPTTSLTDPGQRKSKASVYKSILKSQQWLQLMDLENVQQMKPFTIIVLAVKHLPRKRSNFNEDSA